MTMIFKICPDPVGKSVYQQSLFFTIESFKNFSQKSSVWGSCETEMNCLKGQTLLLPGKEVNH